MSLKSLMKFIVTVAIGLSSASIASAGNIRVGVILGFTGPIEFCPLEINVMFFSSRFQYPEPLRHHFLADTVTRNYSNFQGMPFVNSSFRTRLTHRWGT